MTGNLFAFPQQLCGKWRRETFALNANHLIEISQRVGPDKQVVHHLQIDLVSLQEFPSVWLPDF